MTHHEHLHVRLDVVVQAHFQGVFAQGAQRFIHVQLFLIQINAVLFGQQFDDLRRGDRPVKLVAFAHAHGHAQNYGVDLVGQLLGRETDRVQGGLQFLALLFKTLLIPRRGQDGQALGQKIVASVTRLDLDHLAQLAQFFDIGTKNDFHGGSLLADPLYGFHAVRGGVVQQGHLAGALDLRGQFPLMLRAGSRDAPGNDLVPFSDEISKQVRVLVVQYQFLLSTETTKLLPGSEFSKSHA